jgi:hypothetical protein
VVEVLHITQNHLLELWTQLVHLDINLATVTSVTLELDVDDEITLYGLHTDGGHENTRSATDNEGRCFLEVKEIR